MRFQTVVKFVRGAKGLTQAALSERSGIDKPNLSFFENGRRTPRFDTANELIRSAGFSIAIVPTVRAGVVEISDEIKTCLSQGDAKNAYRLLIQLSDNLNAEEGVNKYALVLAKPNSVGDQAWDAAIGAVVAEQLKRAKLKSPDWVNDFLVSAKQPVTVISGSKWGQKITAKDSTPSFIRRGVLVATRDLQSA